MGLYEEFRFKPAPWLPHSNLPLEELERVRNIKREDMEYTNEHGFSVKVVMDPTLHMVQDMFYRILMSDLNDTPFTMICPTSGLMLTVRWPICSTSSMSAPGMFMPLPWMSGRMKMAMWHR